MIKKILLICSIFIIGAVSFLIYKKINSSNQSTNWQVDKPQTYNSQEYGFSIDINQGWEIDNTFNRGSGEKDGTESLAVTLKHQFSNGTIAIPIYVSQKDWSSVKSEFLEDYGSETIIEKTLAGQPALIISLSKQYYYRIKHPRDNIALVGQATFTIGLPVYRESSNNVNTNIVNSDEEFNTNNFQQTVESILNRLRFN